MSCFGGRRRSWTKRMPMTSTPCRAVRRVATSTGVGRALPLLWEPSHPANVRTQRVATRQTPTSTCQSRPRRIYAPQLGQLKKPPSRMIVLRYACHGGCSRCWCWCTVTEIWPRGVHSRGGRRIGTRTRPNGRSVGCSRKRRRKLHGRPRHCARPSERGRRQN